MLQILVLIITAAANLLLGLLVYLKNPKGLTNKFFFMLTAVFVVWSSVTFVSTHPVVLSQLMWIRLTLCGGALLNLSVFLAFLAFPSAKFSPAAKSRAKMALLATIFIMPYTLTPLVFKELKIVDGNAQPVPSPGIALFMLHTVVLIGSSIYTVAKKFRSSSGKLRSQLRLVIFGIAGTLGIIVITNLFLVVAFNFTALIPFGPAFTIIFSSSFAYAIIKHRLFDIRAALARTLAYVLSLSTMIAIYSLIVFGLAESFLQGSTNSPGQRLFYISCAVLTALFFQPLKRFFDKITNRIFFQDAYDPEFFISQLNKALVSSVELDVLLKKSADLLESNLKSGFSIFAITKTEYAEARLISKGILSIKKPDLSLLSQLAPAGRERVIMTDELVDQESNKALYHLLHDNNIEILVRLTPTLKHDDQSIGYLLIGPKKSGNPYSDQDVRVIGIVANELVIALENALRFEEIENFNVTLQQKVKDATAELRRTNERLRLLDETKDDFISMASHQLRTPLTSVKGYLSMVLEGDVGKVSEKQSSLLNQAFISSQRMVYLIADLLNVSRLRTGKFIIEPSPTNLADVIEGEIAQLVGTAASRNLKLIYDKPKSFPTLMLDETKIRQVIMNFIDNAVHYTPSGGQIEVKLTETPQTVELNVVDNGIGVPKSEQHHLFTKFYRAGNAKKARPDGTGLGLFMAKKVIIAQGGSLIFRSQEGKGSTFGFTFAKHKLLVPAEEPKHST